MMLNVRNARGTFRLAAGALTITLGLSLGVAQAGTQVGGGGGTQVGGGGGTQVGGGGGTQVGGGGGSQVGGGGGTQVGGGGGNGMGSTNTLPQMNPRMDLSTPTERAARALTNRLSGLSRFLTR